MKKPIGVWFPTIQAGTGVDVFTVRLAASLQRRGIRTEITWLPHHAEYFPWTVPIPHPPAWATVVHVNSWLHGRFIPRNVPLVVTLHSCVHDSALLPYKNFAQNIYHTYWIRKCETEILNRADAITAVSHYTRRQAEQVFSRTNIATIYNWVDTTVFTSGETSLPHSPFRLLFAGNLNMRKGADLLGKIMKLLGDDFSLGITSSQNEINQYISCTDNISVLGRMNTPTEMTQIYKGCDALLLPTRLEGLALVALEAQACGIPVIATRGSSVPETILDGSTGILCPQDDVGAFAEAARTLRANPTLWSSMCKAARRHAVDNFHEDKAVDAYCGIYQAVHRSYTDTSPSR